MKKLMVLGCVAASMMALHAGKTSTITFDFNKELENIKPVHGIGQGPLVGWDNTRLFALLHEAGIPYCRLHDVGGALGGNRFVDIPNIFRDFDADENDPKNYDFSFTDEYLKWLVHNGVEPYYRLGVTIENVAYKHHPMRINPPKDYAKWARICEHIIRHYTEGWANGFKWKITYWEIWNEPETDYIRNAMWTGTDEDYFRLYEVTAKYLKEKFPHLKIGGYGSSGFYKVTQSLEYLTSDHAHKRHDYLLSFFERFIAHIKATKAPLDFFSFHSYDTPSNYVVQANFARKYLDDAGYKATEMHCNEWLSMEHEPQTPELVAQIAAMLIAFQNTPTDLGMIYDGKCKMSYYSPLFDASGMTTGSPDQAKVTNAYYAFVYFSELYKLGKRIPVTLDIDGVWTLAATDGKGEAAALVVNTTDKPIFFEDRNMDSEYKWHPSVSRVCAKGVTDQLSTDSRRVPAQGFKLIRYRRQAW